MSMIYSLYIAYIVSTIYIIFVGLFFPQVKQNHIPLSNVLANHSQGKNIQSKHFIYKNLYGSIHKVNVNKKIINRQK